MKAIHLLFLPLTLFIFGFQAKSTAQCSPSTTPGLHIVQKGENLYRIAKAYGVTMEQVGLWNNIDPKGTLSLCTPLFVQAPSVVEAAQAAKTPVATAAPISNAPVTYNNNPQPPAPAAASTTTGQKPLYAYQGRTDGLHVLQAGENIANIAEFYGYSEARFRAMNNLPAGLEPTPGSGLRTTDCDCNMKVWMLNTSNATSGASNVYSPSATTYSTPTTSSPTTTTYPASTNYTNPETEIATRNNNSGAQIQPQPTGATPAPTSGAVASATYMSPEERQMLDEINLLRSNPAEYVKYINEYIAYMQKNGEMGNSISTSYELINELKKTPVLSTLTPTPCIYNAAKKHGIDQKPTGDTNHLGTDGSWPWDRITRECPNMEDGNENLVGGPADIRRAVILLLVDDGIDSRGHRRTLLDERWKYGACYKVGTVGNMPNTWIQNFGF